MVREVGVHLLERGLAESEAVDPDEPLLLVPEHRRDETRAVEHADLDVRLIWTEARRGEVQEREVVLAREILDLLDDRSETAIERVFGVREVLEETRELVEEAAGVHRWLVTPARLGSSDGGSYQEYA